MKRRSAASILCASAMLCAGCECNDPNRPLSADEGASLLKDVRKGDVNRGDLTPAERRYLQQKIAPKGR